MTPEDIQKITKLITEDPDIFNEGWEELGIEDPNIKGPKDPQSYPSEVEEVEDVEDVPWVIKIDPDNPGYIDGVSDDPFHPQNQNEEILEKLQEEIVGLSYAGPGLDYLTKMDIPWEIKDVKVAYDRINTPLGPDDRSRWNIHVNYPYRDNLKNIRDVTFHVAVNTKIAKKLLDVPPNIRNKMLFDIIKAFGSTNTVLRWRQGMYNHHNPQYNPDADAKKWEKFNSGLELDYKVLLKYGLHKEEEEY